MRTAIALLALALATTGCKKKENKPAEPTGSGSAMGSDMGSGSAGSDMGSGSAMAGSGSDTGSAGSAAAGSGAGSAEQMQHKAENCPSMVAGATTKADVKGKTVVVTITTTDKKMVAMVQKKTDDLLAREKTAKTGAEHDQKGTHGGGTGICPVYVPEGATATAKKDKAGSVVTITPKEKPDDLKKAIDERITKAGDWMKANPPAAGGGEGSAAGSGGGAGTGGGSGKGTGGGKGKKGAEKKAAGSGA